MDYKNYLNQDIKNHFRKFIEYKYGNITFYDKRDYDAYVKANQIKYKNVCDSEQSKK